MKRFFALSLALVLVFSLCAGTAASQEEGDAFTVAYIPLDDRPVNVDRVIYQAKASGVTLLMPEEDWYRTVLDDQPKNTNGTQYGDCEALLEWLRSVEGRSDAFVISADQLLSGGLAYSRWDFDVEGMMREGSPERETVAYLRELSRRKPLYLFDTVKRLAATSGYFGYGSAEYNDLRNYSSLPRAWLGGEDLTVENIVAYYEYDGLWNTIGCGGTAISADNIWTLYQTYEYDRLYGYTYETAQSVHDSIARLSADQISQELAARHRKLQLTDWLLREIDASAYFFLGVDDSSVTDSIQSNEINYVQHLIDTIHPNAKVYSGADELGMMALARCVTEHFHISPKLFLRYLGGGENGKSGPFEPETVKQNTEGHIQSLGCEQVDSPEEADITVVMLTIPSDTGIAQRKAVWESAISELSADTVTSARPTIYIDPMSSSMGAPDGVESEGETPQYDVFNRLLLRSPVDLTMLLGYSCWAAGGNPIGIGLAMGVSRYAYLKSAASPSQLSNIGQLQSLTFALVKDICYKHRANAEIEYYLTSGKDGYALSPRLSGSTGNFYKELTSRGWGDAEFADLLRRFLFQKTTYRVAWNGFDDGTDAQTVLDKLESGKLLTDLEEMSGLAVGEVSLSDFSFPWYRTFEARFSCHVALETVTCTYPLNEDEMLVEIPLGLTCAQLTAAFSHPASLLSPQGTTPDSLVGTGAVVEVNGPNGPVVYTAVAPGDVTGDGVCDSDDARRILLSDAAGGILSAAQTAAADLSGDRQIDSADARACLSFAVNQSPSAPFAA